MSAKQRVPVARIYQGSDGDWYWRMRGSNGEIQCQAEGYKTRAGAMMGFEAARRNMQAARLVVDEIKPKG